VITLNQPIQVRDRLLEPGTYVFRLLNSASDRYTVQIFNGDQTRIIDTVFAIPSYRLRPPDKSEFTFWETPAGTARAMRDWYYHGDNYGREFAYPKHPAVLTAALNAPPPGPAPEAEAAPGPPAALPDESGTAEAPGPTQPTEMAESAAAPTPEPAPQPAPEFQPAAQEPAQEPATLPKTASPYPPIGLAGLMAVGLYGLLRRRRTQ
jgi:MYXO-CTERM domain-containing protein